jgi:integrating conjugative element protein (TIGR03749 family)
MDKRLLCLPLGMATLVWLSAIVPGYASEPAADELGKAASPPPEAVTETTEHPPSEPVTTPAKDEIPPDDLRDFGITGLPGLNPPPAAATTPETLPDPPERILWNKTPLRITLPVGQERLVHFPADVRVGFPTPPPPGLRTQSIGGTVYWYAKEPFTTTRVQVQELATGQMILLDLQAQPGADTTPIQILRPAGADPAVTEPGAQNQTATVPAHATANFVQLTRHAAQQLYAPQRLARERPGIHPVPVNTDSIPLVRGGQVEARPLLSWRGGDDYVTAVRLQNLTGQAVILDPRDLRGQWTAATFQHARLLPRGDEADTTCVYLISARPFADAFRGLY